MVLDLHEGGLERLVTDLVLDARARGDVAHVACLHRAGQLAGELRPDEVSVVPQGRLSMVAPVGLARHLRRQRPDVVHLHSGVWFKGAYAARLAGGVPIVFTDHGRPHPDPLTYRLLDALGARLTHCTVAVSDPLGRYLTQRLRVPPSRLRIIPNGIHLLPRVTASERVALRAELGLSSAQAVVGTVGRLDPVKAYDRLLEAFAAVVQEPASDGASPCLLVVGDGPERGALEQLAGRLGLRDRVRLLGWRTDARRLVAAMDLFVLSSDSEGTSVALLEAMAAEVAVVATAVGGTPEVVGTSGAGLLVPPGDSAALAQSIRQLLMDPALRAQMGRIGRDRVLKTFSFDEMAGAYRRLYLELQSAGRVS